MRRRNARPQVPPGCVVYAVGDIHGRLDLLKQILTQIESDAARRTAERRSLVFLGDYVSRGPESKGVIDLLLEYALPDFDVVHLKGNHEALMQRFLAGNLVVGAHWLVKRAPKPWSLTALRRRNTALKIWKCYASNCDRHCLDHT